MGEIRIFENYRVLEEILRYADKKYKYIVKKIQNPDNCSNSFWCLCVSEEEAIERVKNEEEAYDSPDYKFCYEKIEREKYGNF